MRGRGRRLLTLPADRAEPALGLALAAGVRGRDDRRDRRGHRGGALRGLLARVGGALVRALDSAELRSVYDALCARGLRVHVEMPAFVERWRREQRERERGRGGKRLER